MSNFNQVTNVKVMLTHECNLACSYCSDNGSKWKPGLFAHEDRLLNWIKGLSKLNLVMLYGGEPTMSPRHLDLFERLLSEVPQINVGIFTNGTNCSPRLLDILKRPKARITVTKAPDEVSHDKYRVFKSTGKGSYQTVVENIQRFYEACGNRLTVVSTVTPEFVGNMCEGFINDYKMVDTVELNLVRQWEEFDDFSILANQLDGLIDFLVENQDKCLRNFSKYPPIDKERFRRDYYKAIQVTYVSYANGVNQVVIDLDGKIYPGNSIVSKGFSMGDIFGEVNHKYYDFYANIRDNDKCNNCEVRYGCAPNYEVYNPDNPFAPYKIDSYCAYTKVMLNALAMYHKKLKERDSAWLKEFRP